MQNKMIINVINIININKAKKKTNKQPTTTKNNTKTFKKIYKYLS